jgi:hypothetical protein
VYRQGRNEFEAVYKQGREAFSKLIEKGEAFKLLHRSSEHDFANDARLRKLFAWLYIIEDIRGGITEGFQLHAFCLRYEVNVQIINIYKRLQENISNVDESYLNSLPSFYDENSDLVSYYISIEYKTIQVVKLYSTLGWR